MFEDFAAYLDMIVSPERKRIYMNACRALVDVGMVEHGLQIDQQISLAENANTEIFLHSVDTLLHGVYLQVIGEFGVVVDNEAPLEVLTDILEALHRIDDYEDHETIYSMCQAPEGVEVALADIMNLMGAYPPDVYLTHLTRVSPSLLDRIESLHSEEALHELPTRTQVEIARSRVTRFLAKRTVPSMIGIHVAEHGRLGLPLDVIVAPLHDQLETLGEPALIAIELVGLGMGSDVPDADLPAALTAQLELITADPKAITDLHSALLRSLKEYFYE